jgi:hypothetical protein
VDKLTVSFCVIGFLILCLSTLGGHMVFGRRWEARNNGGGMLGFIFGMCLLMLVCGIAVSSLAMACVGAVITTGAGFMFYRFYEG